MSKPQRVLVFGGVGGIGEALTKRLVGQGAHVVITSRSRERVEAAAAQHATDANTTGGAPGDASAGRVTGVVCDVNDKDSIRGAIETASQDGPLTGLAYCVGSINLKPLARCTEQDFMDVYALNVVGAAMAVQMAAASLKASGAGAVVLFSTVAAQQGFANHALIASAKAGVEGLTVSLAAELAPHIRVNAIAPSLSQTPLATKLLASETIATSLARQHPLQRLGTADDHAALAEFLLSANSGWLTGQIIGVDGGRGTLRMARG